VGDEGPPERRAVLVIAGQGIRIRELDALHRLGEPPEQRAARRGGVGHEDVDDRPRHALRAEPGVGGDVGDVRAVPVDAVGPLGDRARAEHVERREEAAT
jgi:hypothetical protein